MVICLERGANLHMAQLMPRPLTVCTDWFYLPGTGSPGLFKKKGLLNGCVCVSLLKFTMDRKLILEVICNWLIDHLTSVYAYHKFVLDSTGSGRGLESASIS